LIFAAFGIGFLISKTKMKIIEKNQLVGTEPGWAVFRNLFEDSNGKRISVHTSHEFWIADERKPGEPHPSQLSMFKKHALHETNQCKK